MGRSHTQRKRGYRFKMHIERDGNTVLVSEPLGFTFDDGRLVLTLRQAKELETNLNAARSWIYDEVEGGNDEDG